MSQPHRALVLGDAVAGCSNGNRVAGHPSRGAKTFHGASLNRITGQGLAEGGSASVSNRAGLMPLSREPRASHMFRGKQGA